MMKKFGIILLSIAFLLSVFSFLPVKKAYCNRPDIALCAAWPWDFYYHNPKGSNHNSGSSALQGQTGNQKAIHHSAPLTTPSHDSDKQKNSQREKNLRDWLLKISLYLRMFLH